MTTPELMLCHCPGACSQVAVYALELAALDYRVRLVDLAKSGQSAPDYLAISPLGKVPALLIDGEPLYENPAILTYIAALRPDSGILPADPSPRMRAESIGGMSFCSGTLHPIVRGLANPMRLTTRDGEAVREKSQELAKKSFGFAEARLARRGSWLGVESIIEVYLNWAFGVARRSGFDVAPFPQLDALAERLMDRPAFAKMQQGEADARATLAEAA